MQAAPRIYIVDDDAGYRDSLSALVVSLGFPTQTFDSGQKYLETSTHMPGCLILDLYMPGTTGAEILKRLAEERISHPVIILTGRAQVTDVVNSYQSGRIVAFLQKQTVDALTLLEAIQLALANDFENRKRHQQTECLKEAFQQLTPPELEVLDGILRGAEHSKMAADLNISRRTVENRRAKIMRKLGATNLPHLIQITIQIGYFPGL